MQNYLDYRLQYTLVEITNYCNLKCPMCPQAFDGGMCEKGFMDFKTFKNIVDNFPRKQKPNALKLFWLGEPMLHPDFNKFLKYASEKLNNPRGYEYITFDSNATLLTKEITDTILDAGDLIPLFTLSLDAIKEETYKKIRIGGNFNKTMENVKYFFKRRHERGLLYPAVMLQFIVMDKNHTEILEFIEFWKDFLKKHFVPGLRHHKDIIWIKRMDTPDPKEQQNLNEFYATKLKEYNIKSQDLGWCRIGAEISNDLRDMDG